MKQMGTPIRINFENMEPSAEARTEIERQVQHLQKFHAHITDCSVTIVAPKTRHQTGVPHQVHIRLAVPPHQDLVVSQHHGDKLEDEHLPVAIAHAFAAAKRQLEEHVQRMRHEVKSRSRQG
jgi:ribosome-associated translation inhibitor RaiA